MEEQGEQNLERNIFNNGIFNGERRREVTFRRLVTVLLITAGIVISACEPPTPTLTVDEKMFTAVATEMPTIRARSTEYRERLDEFGTAQVELTRVIQKFTADARTATAEAKETPSP